VFAVGFNDQFIIAKRHPKSGQIDRSTTEFYVVSVVDGKVHGPVDHEKFSALRARLGVPASLEFSLVIEQLAHQSFTGSVSPAQLPSRRSSDEVLDTQERWKTAMLAKGWQQTGDLEDSEC
jgi:hypothetical protein